MIYPTGIMYYTLWNLVGLFLDANTKAKVKPVMSLAGVREYIDDQYIPKEMVSSDFV